jgi:hypothetical protein
MVPEASRNFLLGIWLTHVGYPLPHCQKGVLDCTRCDRFVFLSFVPVPHSKDDEVGELVFSTGDIQEVRTFADGVAEGGPFPKDLAAAIFGLGGVGGGCDLQSRAEVRVKAVSGLRASSSQGRCCRYRWLKRERKSASDRCWRQDASSAMQFESPGRYWAL